MINFLQTGGNTFVIYCDAANQFTEDYFLVGFENIFTKEWFYAYPTILRRNRRFVELSLSLVPESEEDPFDGSLYLSPNGNWDYRVWNTPNLDLDPIGQELVETGQMQLLTESPEIAYETFISDNENCQSIVYVSPIPDYCLIWNLTRNWWNKQHTQFGACSGQVWNTTELVFDTANPTWNNA
jgi:hypothetical protein